ncbi:glycosyl transferase family group 2-domain-containing protein [Cokeromyces recurvatus]|uniref:glycosyl transferase family group 2-domain-containing protein n=1 Tax=Cokeromyces recurvatus TaxID=90255 RepID=UPI00221F00E3|nr:glycosyl transferase family group 2-domain-containing protein [Cokeromyces recurvatus]KAI7898560.1 glycosyl transferase family group 2-domain-containing protein [Cokeromyces recurvatus]
MTRLQSPSEWVAPLVPIASLAILPLGPIFFPRFYLLLLFLYFTIFLYSQVNHVCKFFLTSRRIRMTIRKWNKRLDTTILLANNNNSNLKNRIATTHLDDETLEDIEEKLHYFDDTCYFHAFILPNYCESEELLKDTIGRIACHSNANTHYAIILAMEQSEPGWESKAQRLESYFADQFAHFIITGHPSNIPGESQGKGSNVAYAARHGCHQLVTMGGIDRGRIMITVSDSDSAIPELYIREVEEALHRSEDPNHIVCAPPIFFSRNCFDVPAAVRVTDITWSAMVMSNLSTGRGMSIPCSNYSLSMVLAEEVGYWDTNADAVGEDMHMWLKCFWKTHGQVRTAPIYVPINLTNVQTEGYLSNVNARYVQAKRHYNGVADVAYTLQHAFCTPTILLYERIKVCLIILEAHMIPATSGWLMFAAVPFMQFILFPPFESLASSILSPSPVNNPILTSEFYHHLWTLTKMLTLFLPLPLFATLAIYEQLHRTIDKEFLKKQNSRGWLHLLDYVNLPIAAWLFMTLPSTQACMKRLLNREEKYITSEKLFK